MKIKSTIKGMLFNEAVLNRWVKFTENEKELRDNLEIRYFNQKKLGLVPSGIRTSISLTSLVVLLSG